MAIPTNTFMDVIDYIVPTDRTLVICDIDETILVQDEFFFGPRIMHSVKWTDYFGFRQMLNRIRQNGKLIFLTARPRLSEPLTRQDFKDLGLNYNQFEVHYTDYGSKGEYITQHINTVQYDRVIFIDDLATNIETVKQAVPGVVCFLFQVDMM
jgi:predicted enzyme involved in methoxymalonyl-ACP biosynthesis